MIVHIHKLFYSKKYILPVIAWVHEASGGQINNNQVSHFKFLCRILEFKEGHCLFAPPISLSLILIHIVIFPYKGDT